MFRIKYLKRNTKKTQLKCATSHRILQQGSNIPETDKFYSTDAFNLTSNNNNKRNTSSPSRLDYLSLRENNDIFLMTMILGYESWQRLQRSAGTNANGSRLS